MIPLSTEISVEASAGDICSPIAMAAANPKENALFILDAIALGMLPRMSRLTHRIRGALGPGDARKTTRTGQAARAPIRGNWECRPSGRWQCGRKT